MGSLKFYHTLRFKISADGKLSVLSRVPYGRFLDSTDLEIWGTLLEGNKWAGLNTPNRASDKEILSLLVEGLYDEEEGYANMAEGVRWYGEDMEEAES